MSFSDMDFSLDDPEFAKGFQVLFTQQHQKVKTSKQESKAKIEELKRNIGHMIKKKRYLSKENAKQESKLAGVKEDYAKANEMVKQAQIESNCVQANIDELFQIGSLELKRFEDIRDESIRIWEEYKSEYESLPLAKVLRKEEKELQCAVDNLSKKEKELEILTGEAEEQRKSDWEALCKLAVDFAQMMIDRRNFEKDNEKKKQAYENHQKELKKLIAEYESLLELHKEKGAKRRLTCFPLMPPPKLNFPQVKTTPNTMNRNIQFRIDKRIYEDDAISVTTDILEDMCIDDKLSKNLNIDDESRNLSPIVEERQSSVANDFHEPLVFDSPALDELNEKNKDLDQTTKDFCEDKDLKRHESFRVSQLDSNKKEEPFEKKLKLNSGASMENIYKVDKPGSNKPKIKSIENVQYDIPCFIKASRSNLSIQSNVFPQPICESYNSDASNSIVANITEISGLSVMDHGVSNFSIFKNFNQFPINKDNTELFKIQKDHKTSEAEKQKNSEFDSPSFMMDNGTDFTFDF